MAYDQILAALEEFDLGGDAEADQARINALRRQQMMGAMGGVMDVPGVQSMGQSMFKQASERLGELESPDRPLARALAQAKVLEAVGGLGPDQTSQVKNLVAAGYQPGTPEFQAAMNQILMKPDTVIGGYGSTPAGWQGVAGPEGTQIQRPVQGSKPYMEATDDLNDMRVALSEIDRLMGLVDKHGTEAWGPESGRMKQLYGQIMSRISALRNMGVLQPGEVALLQSQLTDPGSKGAAVTRTDTVRAQYEQLRSLFEDGLKRAEQPFQTWGYEKPANPYEEQVVDLPPRK